MVLHVFSRPHFVVYHIASVVLLLIGVIIRPITLTGLHVNKHIIISSDGPSSTVNYTGRQLLADDTLYTVHSVLSQL